MENKFLVETSARHIHVTDKTLAALFGEGAVLHNKKDLSQPGQFLSRERVTVKGPKGEFQNVAVLGPERKAGQVEISLTDCRQLGLSAPVRLSGDIEGTPGALLLGPRGTVQLREGVIVARRHVHLTPEAAERFGVAHGQTVRLRTFTDRPLIFEDVAVRVSPDFAPYAHLDFDEANACGFQKGDRAAILTTS